VAIALTALDSEFRPLGVANVTDKEMADEVIECAFRDNDECTMVASVDYDGPTLDIVYREMENA
jgi:hypothetical protein